MVVTTAGVPYPLGATPDEDGTNFALSVGEDAEKVQLCLVDAEGAETCVELTERSGNTCHVHVAGVGDGQKYAYRVHGPWNPSAGLRFNAAKIRLDPYVKAVTGDFNWGQYQFSYDFEDHDAIDTSDSLGHTMLGVVVDDSFEWGEDAQPDIPFNETVIYETHVKGMTKLHPEVPEKARGTYAGLAHPAVLKHFTTLDVAAVERMPVHRYTNDSSLQDKGISNYWGCNTQGYFAPQNTYSSVSRYG